MERNSRPKKQNLTFVEYCQLIEELLKLTGRKTPMSKPMPAQNFKL